MTEVGSPKIQFFTYLKLPCVSIYGDTISPLHGITLMSTDRQSSLTCPAFYTPANYLLSRTFVPHFLSRFLPVSTHALTHCHFLPIPSSIKVSRNTEVAGCHKSTHSASSAYCARLLLTAVVHGCTLSLCNQPPRLITLLTTRPTMDVRSLVYSFI